MKHHAQHASPRRNRRAAARILGLAAVAGLGLAAAPVAHADDALQGAAVPQGAAAPQADVSQLAGVQQQAGFPIPQQADVSQQAGVQQQADLPQQAAASQLGGLPLYPLAGTPLDLLSNNLRVPVGGMDVSTFPVTAPLRDGLPLREVPIVGALLP
jgi:hypothetical protein